MGGARSRQAGRVQRAKRIQGQVALVFLALGSIGSFLLGHEIAGDLAVQAIYTTASQDQLKYSPVTLSASGALGASVSARRTPRGGGSRARGQAPSGKSGQAHSGQISNPAGQGHLPGSTARGADGSPTASDISGSSITQSGSPGALPPDATMPGAALPCVASSPADIALSGIDGIDGIDDAGPAGKPLGGPSPSTDQVSDETTGRPCTTASSAPLLLALLANPHDASVAGTEA